MPFNDNNQRYSVILESEFSHTSWQIIEPRLLSRIITFKVKIYLHEILCCPANVISLLETQYLEFAGWESCSHVKEMS